ncbi:hypothetical protein IHN63_09715 [Deinococcus sp. 6YEL10]|uniref:hypothetical protein n=1 Tax=Deinococcus sp. 6YEL10 TaxID=2745870 RepID=UPI001E599595|nr:hypothetical protein [Deinococcus sp. 6YEL10]MCD0161582.1 hypothetical protein [Deinococcus sp. 6YEL10]
MTSVMTVAPEAPARPLPFWRRFVWAFGVVYVFLAMMVGTQPLLPVTAWPWVQGAVDRVSRLVFGQPVVTPPDPTGSGDTQFDWAWLFCLLCLSVLAGLVWASWQRTAPTARQTGVLSEFLRMALAAWLTSYGLAKFGFGQFGLLPGGTLDITYADSSPMGLLWRFMGASAGYQWLAGVAEVLPALLLLHRRTVTLGALMAAVTMTNVFALNLFYDVPVKLFSGHLLLIATLLLAMDARRLRALLTGEAVPAVVWAPQVWWRRLLPWVLTCVILVLVGVNMRAGLQALRVDRGRTQVTQEPLKTRGFHLINEVPFHH